MEEGILPHSQSNEQSDEIEEERRLCYVGMTRAREQLYCLHSLERRLHGKFREQSPSPFLAEIPEEVKEAVRLGSTRFTPSQPSWRDQPMRDGSGARASSPAPPRNYQAPPRVGGGTQKPDSTTSVFSFFKDAPVQFDPSAIKPAATKTENRAELKRGQRVRHEQFGDGTILTMEGSGPDAKITVYFERAGSKKFIAKYAKLMRI
jgi:DNA helicase II / ATP-dependent DNA helicase PcrA